MKKVLLVEDDSFKSDEILGILRAVGEPVDFCCATCVADAVSTIREQSFDLIVLDMALPSHPVVAGGGAPLSLLTGGIEVLFELQSLGRTDPCVVITQYPEIEICGEFYPVSAASAAILENYEIAVFACLDYSSATNDWRPILLDAFRKS